MFVESYILKKLYEEYKNVQSIERYCTARDVTRARAILTVYAILYALFIFLYIAGIVTAFTRIKQDKKVLAVVISVFMPIPFFWVLYFAGAFN